MCLFLKIGKQWKSLHPTVDPSYEKYLFVLLKYVKQTFHLYLVLFELHLFNEYCKHFMLYAHMPQYESKSTVIGNGHV